MTEIFEEDFPNRFSYKLKATIEYPYPFEKTPTQGTIIVAQCDELGEFQWERLFTWHVFWPRIAERISNEYDPKWQSGFAGWFAEQPRMGYDDECGNIEVEIDVYIPYKHKFEDEIDSAEVCLVLKFNKKTGELLECYIP